MYLRIKSYTLTPRAPLTPIRRGIQGFKRYCGGHSYITLLYMKSIIVYYTITLLYEYYQVTSIIINYHQLSSATSIIVSWCLGATSLMLYAFSIYRRVRRRSYYSI